MKDDWIRKITTGKRVRLAERFWPRNIATSNNNFSYRVRRSPVTAEIVFFYEAEFYFRMKYTHNLVVVHQQHIHSLHTIVNCRHRFFVDVYVTACPPDGVYIYLHALNFWHCTYLEDLKRVTEAFFFFILIYVSFWYCYNINHITTIIVI